MKDLLVKLSVKWELLKDAVEGEEGQDLVEYAMIVAFIALVATASMSALASSVDTAFRNVGTTLTTYTG